jgi:hypothetical protein
MVSIHSVDKTLKEPSGTHRTVHPKDSKSNYETNGEKHESINLSTAQIVLVGLLFTLLQKLSVSRLGNSTGIITIIVMGIISIIVYSTAHQFPLTIDTCWKKIKLTVNTIELLSQNIKFDVWTIIIIVLVIVWILSVWKSGISFTLWYFIIWVYNLKENTQVSDSLSDKPYCIDLNDHHNSNIRFNTNNWNVNSQNSVSTSSIKIEEQSFYDKNYFSSIEYIKLLEKRIIDLEKKIDSLDNEKLQQNVRIYTFNNNLNEKLNNLEKTMQIQIQQTQFHLSNFNEVLLSMKKRKRKRFNIFKLYFKVFLLWMLPNSVVSGLKRIRRKLREYFYCIWLPSRLGQPVH